MTPRRNTGSPSRWPLLLSAGLPLCAAGMLPVRAAHAATDLRFDYTSFETGFQQPHFNVLNYPSINGSYMMTSTDNHRPEMVANNNALAEFYNNWLADYNKSPRPTAAQEADAINTYTINNSNNNGPRPTWLILNELSSSLWSANPGAPSLSAYRTWAIECVTRLRDVHGYNVVALAPFQNPGQNNASWDALSDVAYVGIECYLSGTEVWNSGSTDAERLNWARSQYQASKNSYLNRGVPANKLFLTEHFANNAATYVDNQGVTRNTGWGRAGLASAADWDTVIGIRNDAIKAVGFDGFLAYNWGGNAMNVSQAEQLQHEYVYRTHPTLASQQPQWLPDGAIDFNGTTIPLSWAQSLNWVAGVPNATGAVANFFRTNTTARTITLDGSKTVGTLTFNSPQSYIVAPGTGGTLTLNSGASAANVSVSQGSHTISAGVALSSNSTFSLASGTTLSISGAISGSGALTKSGAGTLALSNSGNTYSGITKITGGVVTVTADTCLGAVPGSFSADAITLDTGGIWRNVGGSAVTIPASRGITVLSGGGTLDFSSTAGVPALNSKISGTGMLTKMGVRTLQVGGDSSATFTGGWLIKQGRVNVATNGTVNSLGTGVITLSPGTGDVAQLGVGASGGIVSELQNDIALSPTGTGATSFEVNAGNTLALSGVISGTGALRKSGGSSTGAAGGAPLVTAGTLVLKGNNTYTGGTVVNDGTLVAASSGAFSTGALSINTGATGQLQPDLAKALALSSVTTGGTGKLDLTNNSLVLRNSSVAAVQNLVRQGFSNGAWNGPGITSTTAAANPAGNTAIGFAANSFLNRSAFKGITGLTGSDVLVKYTYYGDADLTGAVSLDDFTLFLNGYQNAGTTWAQGDFDYSGTVTLNDFALFLSGYQNQGAPLSELGETVASAQLTAAERQAMLAALQAVPEPSAVAAIGFCAAAFLPRRRNSR